MSALKVKVPWFYCVKNRVWSRRMSCKHSVCKDRAIHRMSIDAPKDRPE